MNDGFIFNQHVPEVALQGVYTAICHATSKTVKRHLLFEFPEKKYIYYIRSVHMRTETVRYEYVYINNILIYEIYKMYKNI